MRTTEKDNAQKYILGDLYQLCYRAFYNTSFSPEKRALSYIKEYSEILESDLKELGENQGNYREKYISKFSDWMGAKGRCISSMITGPSNFPVRKAQKANQSEHNKSVEFSNWRERYFKAVNRVPTKSPEEELILAERNLEFLINFQFEVKEINKEIRSSKLTDLKEIISHLVNLDYSPKTIQLIDFRGGKYKIPSYVLTNNNATIKRTQDKVKIMQTRIERKNTWEDITFEGGYLTIEDDRVKIFHDEKPEKEVIQEIKSNGFRWSPHWKCWTRKHTGNAIYTAQRLSFIKKVAA